MGFVVVVPLQLFRAGAFEIIWLCGVHCVQDVTDGDFSLRADMYNDKL